MLLAVAARLQLNRDRVWSLERNNRTVFQVLNPLLCLVVEIAGVFGSPATETYVSCVNVVSE